MFPSLNPVQVDYIISTWSKHCPYHEFVAAAFNGQNYPAANSAFYYPILIDRPFTFDRFFTVNGSSAGNVDVGLYDKNFNKIISTGSTALSGSNAVQLFTVAKTKLLPGLYFLAIAASSTSYQPWRSAAAGSDLGAVMGFFSQTSALPLPSTATPVAFTGAQIQYFGMRNSAIF